MSFIFKITTTTSPQTFVIPCTNTGTFNATVDYGDGTGSQTVTAYNDSNLTHSFATAGQHTITIDGTFPNVRFYDNTASRVLVDEVVDLGDVNWINLYQAFRDCSNLTAFNAGTTDTSSVPGMYQMFTNCSSLTSLDLSSFDTSSASNMGLMFYNCSNLTSLDVTSFNTSSVNSMQQMFYNCSSLTTLDVTSFNTSNVTSMREMFRGCSNLTTLDLTSFDTSIVTDMVAMFNSCSNLTTLDLSSFDTSSATSMQAMFLSCTGLTSLDLNSFDTSSVTDMNYMFFACYGLTSLDLSSFDTSSVTDMSVMFGNSYNLTSLGLSSFDTSSVTNIQSMFANCLGLTSLNIKHFDVSNVTNGTSFLLNANNALTTTAYDELLEAWAAQDVQPNVPWHFGDAQYTVETIADWYSPRSASSLSIINNKLVSIADSAAIFGAGQQVDNLIVGNVYKMKARSTCNNAAATMFLSVSVDATLTPSVIFTQGTSTALIDSLFTATATTMYFGVIVNGHAANDTVTLDAGITVKEITNYTEANAASEIEYSQENVFGSEEVVNGDFATDLNGYTFNAAAWEWDGGKASKYVTPDSSTLEQLFTFVIGKAYSITVEWSDVSGGNPVLKVGNSNTIIYPETTAIVIGANQSKFSLAGNAALFKVDNISVKEITNAVEYKNIPQSARELYSLDVDTWTGSNEVVTNGDFATDSDWTKETGWSISNGEAVATSAPNGSSLYQNAGLVVDKTYLIKYEIKNFVSGEIVARCGNTFGTFNASNGVYSETLVCTSSSNIVIRTGANTTCSIDNVSVKEVIEVAEQAVLSPVTTLMTLTEAWTTSGTGYSTLGSATSASVRVDATISNTDDGILMEAGGSGSGAVLYVHSGVLYFQCGRGGVYGTDSDTAEVSYTLPVGEFDYIIEWSADTSNAVLYVNGLLVASQTFSNSVLSGTDDGTLGRVETAVAANRGGWTSDGSGVYTNTITKCDVFVNQVTSDV